ncbi:MAG: bifunctional aldolase/short-chain dehydrogenase [Candidatus Latescibacterota bacterium]|jgi:rhamnose utilization protein RhaD (predicted bifunctional aldolase and dehydrogenase)/NAD(P)-dependent dehydrogenase (short-subunit alcohol dehydrogenase family)
MKSKWDEKEFTSCGENPLDQRVYTARLIGRESDLVLYGGGNVSVKMEIENTLGESEEVLFVSGSGVDLGTIDRSGFSPVRLDMLRQAAELSELSDSEMARFTRTAMTDAGAVSPSVEAILHAIIPFKFVDHTHADAVVTITNTEKGMERIGQIYGDRMFIVPYVMPGFLLAKEIYDMTRDINWEQVEGMILLNHGVFTFGNDATTAYMRMIQIVTVAEDYVEKRASVETPANVKPKEDLIALAMMRKAVSEERDGAVIARVDTSPQAVHFSGMLNVDQLAGRGPLTPDHVIWTKRVPMVVENDPVRAVDEFVTEYRGYFDRNTDGTLTCLDPAPRWAVWPEFGTVSFGRGWREASIIRDVTAHTLKAVLRAEGLGGWHPLGEEDVFDVEYWSLQRAKLDRLGPPAPMAGKVVLVTGGASGIGRACAELMNERGAAVFVVDVDPGVDEMFQAEDVSAKVCDITDVSEVAVAVEEAVRHFGGIDILVSNAGIFPTSETIAEVSEEAWDRSIDVNLTGHKNVLEACIPFLEHGVDPSVVVIGSKNVPAPGRGAAAYSVAKAGLTQLARVAALELGPKGIRVNTLHPDHIFDTGIWTDEVLEGRARHYGMSVEEYKTRNLLKVEILSRDVAELACVVAGPAFARTTGAQIPIDGGNDRVI